jgi:hypothetical protein
MSYPEFPISYSITDKLIVTRFWRELSGRWEYGIMKVMDTNNSEESCTMTYMWNSHLCTFPCMLENNASHVG